MKVRNDFGMMLSAVLLLSITGLSGCAAARPARISAEPPDWVIKGSGAFKDAGDKVFYGVGAVTGIRNKPLAVSAADNRARAEITKVFETYTASLMRDYAASTTGGGAVSASSPATEEQYIEQAIKTFSAATLSGVMIIDHWVDPTDGSYYSLARLDLENFKMNVEKIKELNAEVREYIKKNAEKAFESLAQEEEKRGH